MTEVKSEATNTNNPPISQGDYCDIREVRHTVTGVAEGYEIDPGQGGEGNQSRGFFSRGGQEGQECDSEISFYDKFVADSLGYEERLARKSSSDVLASEERRKDKELFLKQSEVLDLDGQIEAILFAAPNPLKIQEIFDLLNDEETSYTFRELDQALKRIERFFNSRNGGLVLVNEKGLGFQFQTTKAAAPLMEKMFSTRPRPLSRAALETLAIIAYRQPATRADVEFIRGVDSGSIIKNLMERELIQCVGRREESGRPMLFGTTGEFLKVFKLETLEDLPPLSAFQPAHDLIRQANQKLNEFEEVDVEKFISDEDREPYTVSAGLEFEKFETDLFGVGGNKNNEKSCENLSDVQDDTVKKNFCLERSQGDNVLRESDSFSALPSVDDSKQLENIVTNELSCEIENNINGQKMGKRIEGAVSGREKARFVPENMDSNSVGGNDSHLEEEDPFWEIALVEKKNNLKNKDIG